MTRRGSIALVALVGLAAVARADEVQGKLMVHRDGRVGVQGWEDLPLHFPDDGVRRRCPAVWVLEWDGAGRLRGLVGEQVRLTPGHLGSTQRMGTSTLPRLMIRTVQSGTLHALDGRLLASWAPQRGTYLHLEGTVSWATGAAAPSIESGAERYRLVGALPTTLAEGIRAWGPVAFGVSGTVLASPERGVGTLEVAHVASNGVAFRGALILSRGEPAVARPDEPGPPVLLRSGPALRARLVEMVRVLGSIQVEGGGFPLAGDAVLLHQIRPFGLSGRQLHRREGTRLIPLGRAFPRDPIMDEIRFDPALPGRVEVLFEGWLDLRDGGGGMAKRLTGE